jgi:hypothetical protein
MSSTADLATEIRPEDVTPKATAADYLASTLFHLAQVELNEAWCRQQGKLAQQDNRDAVGFYARAEAYREVADTLRSVVSFAEGSA